MNPYKNLESIRQQMKMARRMSGLTQAELAKKMKTKQSAISRAENGQMGSFSFVERFISKCGFLLRFNHVTIESPNGDVSHSVFTSRQL